MVRGMPRMEPPDYGSSIVRLAPTMNPLITRMPLLYCTVSIRLLRCWHDGFGWSIVVVQMKLIGRRASCRRCCISISVTQRLVLLLANNMIHVDDPLPKQIPLTLPSLLSLYMLWWWWALRRLSISSRESSFIFSCCCTLRNTCTFDTTTVFLVLIFSFFFVSQLLFYLSRRCSAIT